MCSICTRKTTFIDPSLYSNYLLYLPYYISSVVCTHDGHHVCKHTQHALLIFFNFNNNFETFIYLSSPNSSEFGLNNLTGILLLEMTLKNSGAHTIFSRRPKTDFVRQRNNKQRSQHPPRKCPSPIMYAPPMLKTNPNFTPTFVTIDLFPINQHVTIQTCHLSLMSRSKPVICH